MSHFCIWHDLCIICVFVKIWVSHVSFCALRHLCHQCKYESYMCVSSLIMYLCESFVSPVSLRVIYYVCMCHLESYYISLSIICSKHFVLSHRYHCVSITCHCVSFMCHCVSITCHCVSYMCHCVSFTCHCV